MFKILLLSFVFLSANAFSQVDKKPNPDSQVNAQEQINGLPEGSQGGNYLIRTKKRTIKVSPVIAPVENQSPANCADSLGGKGSANFTACEAAKRSR